MATRMQQRRGTAAQWTAANPILAAGEIGFETDTNQFKIGDGTNQWADLSYFKNLEDLGGSFDDYVLIEDVGVPNGIATLDSNGSIPMSQLANLVGTAPATLDTIQEIADTLTAVDGLLNLAKEAAIDEAAADATAKANQAEFDAIAAAALDATAKANTAQSNAETTASGYVSTHNSETTNIHGIADTAALATKTYADDAVSTHNSDTTNVHGIADTSVLATQTDIQGAKDYADDQIDVHVAVTTHVHGIADTSKIVLTDAVSTTLDGSLTVDGDLIVNGTTTTVSAQDLVVSDPLIYIGEGNTANLVDLGLVSSYNDGTYQHSGIVRDSSANKWKLFKGVTDEPTTTVNFAQGSLDDLAVNNVEVVGVVFSDGTQSKQGVPSLTPISQKTDSYTLSALSERDSLIEINKESAVTLTIPADASVNFPVGTSLDILQTGAGQVTIAGAGGVTVNATPGLKLRTQWSSATLFKRAANTWVVFGDLSA